MSIESSPSKIKVRVKYGLTWGQLIALVGNLFLSFILGATLGLFGFIIAFIVIVLCVIFLFGYKHLPLYEYIIIGIRKIKKQVILKGQSI
jgi:hypothetical protein